MIQTIVYTSNTGFTEKYAKLLAEKIKLPVYSLNDAAAVPPGTEIIYLGWLMASGVKGYKKASRRYKVQAVCGVGMGATGLQLPEVRKQNAIPESIPVFTMQGGFDMTRLHGIYKMMMSVMRKTAGKALEKKQDKTAEEAEMLDMMINGKDCVSLENLAAVIRWYEEKQGYKQI